MNGQTGKADIFQDFLKNQGEEARALLLGHLENLEPGFRNLYNRLQAGNVGREALDSALTSLIARDAAVAAIFRSMPGQAESTQINTSGSVSGDQTIIGSLTAGRDVNFNFGYTPRTFPFSPDRLRPVQDIVANRKAKDEEREKSLMRYILAAVAGGLLTIPALYFLILYPKELCALGIVLSPLGYIVWNKEKQEARNRAESWSCILDLMDAVPEEGYQMAMERLNKLSTRL